MLTSLTLTLTARIDGHNGFIYRRLLKVDFAENWDPRSTQAGQRRRLAPFRE
jgi:hypothetical protein